MKKLAPNMVTEKEDPKYKDIMDLPHRVSPKRPHMSLEDRAAQFAPFAAVVGHEAAVNETARLTEDKRILDENQKTIINQTLIEIQSKIECQVEVEIEYFKPDLVKDGGQYQVIKGSVKMIDIYSSHLLMADGVEIAIDDIIKIHLL